MTRVIRMKHFADGHTEEIIEESVTDTPTAPDRTTTGETASGAIQNALQIATTWAQIEAGAPAGNAFAGVARLLRDALRKLQEKP